MSCRSTGLRLGGPVASWYPLAALAWLFVAAACDMLDGAVARSGNLHSRFGAVLDSTVDRFSDIAIWGACALYFAAAGNVTYCLLTFLALSNTFLISYVKARAEDLIPDCSVGFWQRGERFFAILVGLRQRARGGSDLAAGDSAVLYGASAA